MKKPPSAKNRKALPRRRARKGEAKKLAVSIRLSPEVIAFFKAKGPGWQTRIDKALRALVAGFEEE